MSYAARMVHFDDSRTARSRLAADLARRFDAVLIGITGYSHVATAAAGSANGCWAVSRATSLRRVRCAACSHIDLG
jgi:hypothetical protein